MHSKSPKPKASLNNYSSKKFSIFFYKKNLSFFFINKISKSNLELVITKSSILMIEKFEEEVKWP